MDHFLELLEVLCLGTVCHWSLVFHSQFISIAFIHSHIFYTFHPTLSLHIYGAPGLFSHLGVYILLFKQQFKASSEQFYNSNYAAEGQHERII